MPPAWTPVATWDVHPPRRGFGYLIDASLDSLNISCRSLRPSTLDELSNSGSAELNDSFFLNDLSRQINFSELTHSAEYPC
jgi:hypothetical protein